MTARVTIIGNVGREPELKMSAGGKSYAKFSVATRSGKKLQDGSWAQDYWWEVICFGDLADQVGRNIRRGSYVEVEGKFGFDEYKKRDGSPGQKFTCSAERVTEKEKPVGKVSALEFSSEIEKPMTGWGKAHEASLLPDSPRDAFDRENHYTSSKGSDYDAHSGTINFQDIPF